MASFAMSLVMSPVPSLPHHVVHVVFAGSNEEMLRIEAYFIVAFMADMQGTINR